MYRNDGSVGRSAIVASPTSCGIGNEAMVWFDCAVSTYATAELVVPRSMPTMNRGFCMALLVGENHHQDTKTPRRKIKDMIALASITDPLGVLVSWW
jgi:hypothetical protein